LVDFAASVHFHELFPITAQECTVDCGVYFYAMLFSARFRLLVHCSQTVFEHFLRNHRDMKWLP